MTFHKLRELLRNIPKNVKGALSHEKTIGTSFSTPSSDDKNVRH